MKTVIGIFLTMVFVVLMASIAFGEKNPTDVCDSEVYAMVEDWARNQKVYDNYNWKLESGVYHGMGVISESDFKEISGKEFSLDNLKNLYFNCKNYGYDWDITDCEIRTVGFIEGYNVYILDMSTNKVPLGSTWNYDICEEQNYYHVSMLFMVSM